jgi:hypothetical protein
LQELAPRQFHLILIHEDSPLGGSMTRRFKTAGQTESHRDAGGSATAAGDRPQHHQRMAESCKGSIVEESNCGSDLGSCTYAWDWHRYIITGRCRSVKQGVEQGCKGTHLSILGGCVL